MKNKLIKENKFNIHNSTQYLKDNIPQKELTATRLGKLRVDIKKHLAEGMREIDKVVKNLIS